MSNGSKRSIIGYKLIIIILMQSEDLGISKTHNLFLHRLVDNEQAKSVTFMKLDTHTTLYREGTENRYLVNLVIAGRNFI